MLAPDAPAPYELTLEVRDKYLYAYVIGEHDSYEISFAYWSEIARKLAELNLDRLLVVEDIAEQSPLVDVYEISAQLVDMGFRGIRIAFVDRYASHKDLNDFGVIVGSNRGLLGQAFSDETEALTWLLSK